MSISNNYYDVDHKNICSLLNLSDQFMKSYRSKGLYTPDQNDSFNKNDDSYFDDKIQDHYKSYKSDQVKLIPLSNSEFHHFAKIKENQSKVFVVNMNIGNPYQLIEYISPSHNVKLLSKNGELKTTTRTLLNSFRVYKVINSSEE